MIDILKNLAPSELATVLIVLGIIREARLLIKLVLEYKLQVKKLQYKK